jgi:hypothetical protein
MLCSRFRFARFLFYLLACVLMCAAVASELPEDLTLTNDTSNDYKLQSSTFLKYIQTLTVLRQIAAPRNAARPLPSWHSLSAVSEGGSVQVQGLFILYSVLRT